MRMERTEIVQETLEWVGTKWQHQQARKGIACDCAGLVRGVYAELTSTKIEVMDYPATWHLFKSYERMYETCKLYFEEIPLEQAREGDLLLFAYRDSFVAHHIGILVDENHFVHSDMDIGKVVKSPLDNVWLARRRYAFRLREVENG